MYASTVAFTELRTYDTCLLTCVLPVCPRLSSWASVVASCSDVFCAYGYVARVV
ncbi:Uncharacterised protein [Mycobacteroides abscessus subsp. abscessus]|nr:Uncharacterised protein [Mycobacteroides abscessus subsp. abscessus]